MTQEDRKLLLTDLCARLPYKVECEAILNNGGNYPCILTTGTLHQHIAGDHVLKPYLRPMSSMTINEKREYATFICSDSMTVGDMAGLIDWLNAHHFDYRGLIEKELALEAPESMYDLNK